MIKKDTLTKGIMIGIPTLFRPVCIDWALALKSLNPPINFQTKLMKVENQEVAAARNHLAQAAIDTGCEFLMLIGDDTQPPGHTLHQLVYRMQMNPQLGVVGGVYCSKSTPAYPLVFRGNGSSSFWGWKVGEYFPVTGLGMDCTLIRTQVFKDLKPPWFKTVRKDSHLDGIAAAESWTEDLWFCQRVQDEVPWWDICADAMVMCLHWSLEGGKWKAYQLPSDSLPFLSTAAWSDQIAQEGDKQILDLGCGPVHHDFGAEGVVTRCDIREDCEPDWTIDIRQLPFEDQTFDVVFSSHTLEHFPRDQVDNILEEWVRVLKLGGEIRLVIPNIAWAAQKILEGDVSWDAMNVLYGSQEYSENFHRVGFTPETLKAHLAKAGIQVTQVSLFGYNMVLKGLKCHQQL